MVQRYGSGFMSSQSTRKEESEKRPISFSLELVIVWSRPEPLTLLCGEPVPKTHAKFLHPSHMPNARCRITAQETAIGCFVC